MSHKIVFEEHPGAPDLRSGHAAGLRALAQFLRVDPKKVRGLGEVVRLTTPGRPWSGQGGGRSDGQVFQFPHGTKPPNGRSLGNAAVIEGVVPGLAPWLLG